MYSIIGTWVAIIRLPSFTEAVDMLRGIGTDGAHILHEGKEVAHYSALAHDVVRGPRRILFRGSE